MSQTRGEITRLLESHRDGSTEAFDRLVEIAYHDLKRIAHRQVSDHDAGTLNTTGLVHEAYAKLARGTRAEWQSRKHFFAAAARAMRHVVIDHARKRMALKRDEALAVPLTDVPDDGISPDDAVVLAVHEALSELAKIDEQLVRIVECRFFAGYSVPETATILDSSVRTVERDWARAKAWLRDTFEEDGRAI